MGTRAIATALTAAVLLAMTACGGTEPADRQPEPDTPDPAGNGGGATKAVDATEPGTKLSFGEPAVVPLSAGPARGMLQITVTAVEEGDPAALVESVGDKAKGFVPYFVRITVENADGSSMAGTAIGGSDVDAVDESGGNAGVPAAAFLDACVAKDAPEEFTTAGTTYQTCVLRAAKQGAPVSGAAWKNRDGGYHDDPIVWQP